MEMSIAYETRFYPGFEFKIFMIIAIAKSPVKMAFPQAGNSKKPPDGSAVSRLRNNEISCKKCG